MTDYLFLAATLDSFGREITPVRVSRDVILVMAASVALATVLFCWAFFVRKRRRRDRSPWEEAAAVSEGKKRRRRRRRSHRMNPTLADTGGLPRARKEPKSTSE